MDPASFFKILTNSTLMESEVRYSLLDWKQRYWFTVQPHTGVVAIVSPLDRETTAHLTVPLEARTSQGSAEATLYVTVEDVNEFSPRFANDVYQTQITEEDDRHLPKPVIQVRPKSQNEFILQAFTARALDGVSAVFGCRLHCN
ncbi:putative neural-cadherin 2 [Hyalella azteca]|uniref:Neural-cadherin 2 n=1 Tax=Hyalella azteca TaxID=294128 RepID=A0A979FTH1_HYAAZ|nr:putative neural-cadherin 2 [Hyalella azteca]